MGRDGPLTNSVSGANNNNSNAYLTDLHSHSVQSKFAHVRIDEINIVDMSNHNRWRNFLIDVSDTIKCDLVRREWTWTSSKYTELEKKKI